ncbi:MAG: hypothetical protein KDB22_29775 [Planctomycetales bacterium]|nr:hypothetical protein [Planctomycetales bacterium]
MKIDGRSYSPKVLEIAMFCVARDPAYKLAAETLQETAGIQISARHLRNLAVEIGRELEDVRDTKAEAYFEQPLPRVPTAPSTPIALASVSVDGGRTQTRLDGGPNGVHEPHWRETKNAVFMRMTGVQFDRDPHPELPDCFQDREYMKTRLSGLEDAGVDCSEVAKSDLKSWRPERLFRTCLSSLCDSDSFGRMMEAEADSRGFFAAQKRAFVGDGLQYNWTIQQRHFQDFTPILDFTHAIERTYEAARSVQADSDQAWACYVRWATACWHGRVLEMLLEMRQHQEALGLPPKECEEKDSRKMLAEAITYFENNVSRMDYPRYRKEGLPLTSAYMESFVKEMNYRVKGTEKFWNDGPSGEAILQLRAAKLSDDDRLRRHMRSRPGNPFRPNIKRESNISTNA